MKQAIIEALSANKNLIIVFIDDTKLEYNFSLATQQNTDEYSICLIAKHRYDEILIINLNNVKYFWITD